MRNWQTNRDIILCFINVEARIPSTQVDKIFLIRMLNRLDCNLKCYFTTTKPRQNFNNLEGSLNLKNPYVRTGQLAWSGTLTRFEKFAIPAFHLCVQEIMGSKVISELHIGDIYWTNKRIKQRGICTLCHLCKYSKIYKNRHHSSQHYSQKSK